MLYQLSKIGAATRSRVLENGVPCCLSRGSGYNRKAKSKNPSLSQGLPSDARFSSSLPTQAQVMNLNLYILFYYNDFSKPHINLYNRGLLEIVICVLQYLNFSANLSILLFVHDVNHHYI